MRRFVAWFAVAWLASGQVYAQGTQQRQDEARALFDRGVTAADELRWAEAASWFERSYAVVPRPATLRNLGLADRALGRYVRSIGELERFLEVASPTAAMSREVRRLVDEMRARVATLTVEVDPANTSLLVDGATALAETPLQLDPGDHTVQGSARGYSRSTQRLTLGAGERRSLRVSLSREALAGDTAARGAAPAPHNGGSVFTRWWFWTTIGVVVAGGVTASVLLLSSESPPDCGSLGACLTPQ